MVLAGTSFVTTAPAPTMAFSPTERLARMVAPDPIEAPFLMIVFSTFQSASVCKLPAAAVARGEESLINITPWPMKTLSSMVTPSQMKAWLEILQRFPTDAFFWISTNAPILVSSPISQPYRLMNLESLTSRPSFTLGAILRNSSIKIVSQTAPCLLLDGRGDGRQPGKSYT